MNDGAFAPNEQMLHFPSYFQIHVISKALLWREGLIFGLFESGHLTQVLLYLRALYIYQGLYGIFLSRCMFSSHTVG